MVTQPSIKLITIVTRKNMGKGEKVLTTQLERERRGVFTEDLLEGQQGFVPNLEVQGLHEETD